MKNKKLRYKKNKKFTTYDSDSSENGYLVPIYNINDGFFKKGKEPQQVYLTVIKQKKIKGPHMHYIRTGFFTCIKGDAKFVLKTDNGFEEFYSGENYDYLSIEVPTGTPAALQNIGSGDAFVLNMPNPAWTPDMDDEYTADFSEYDFKEK